MKEDAVYEVVRERLGNRRVGGRAEAFADESLESALAEIFEDLQMRGVGVEPGPRERIKARLVQEALGFGSLSAVLADPEVTEVVVHGSHQVFVERRGQTARADFIVPSDELRGIINRMLTYSMGKRLDAATPYVDLSLPGGTRVNIVIPPAVVGGPHLTFRRHRTDLGSLDGLVALGTLSEEMAEWLRAAIKVRANLVFIGASGSGKTTLVDMLAPSMDTTDRIVTIEDTLELRLEQPDVVRMLTRGPNVEGRGEITITDLFRNALRMHPTRILLGEIRGKEALDYLSAVTSGHRGSLAVLHAASPEEAVVRMEYLTALAGLAIPASVTRTLIAKGIDAIVLIQQDPDGVRRVYRITEIMGQDDLGDVVLQDAFRFAATGWTEDGQIAGRFERVPKSGRMVERFRMAGLLE